MCYGMNCMYEKSNGECKKTLRIPCPVSDPDGHERYFDKDYEQGSEDARNEKARSHND